MFPITDLIQPYFHEWIAKYRSKIIKKCKWHTSIWALIFWEQRGFPWCMNWSKLSRWGMIYYFHNASCMIFLLDSMISDYYLKLEAVIFSFFKLIWPLVKIILWPLFSDQWILVNIILFQQHQISENPFVQLRSFNIINRYCTILPRKDPENIYYSWFIQRLRFCQVN